MEERNIIYSKETWPYSLEPPPHYWMLMWPQVRAYLLTEFNYLNNSFVLNQNSNHCFSQLHSGLWTHRTPLLTTLLRAALTLVSGSTCPSTLVAPRLTVTFAQGTKWLRSLMETVPIPAADTVNIYSSNELFRSHACDWRTFIAQTESLMITLGIWMWEHWTPKGDGSCQATATNETTISGFHAWHNLRGN